MILITGILFFYTMGEFKWIPVIYIIGGITDFNRGKPCLANANIVKFINGSYNKIYHYLRNN